MPQTIGFDIPKGMDQQEVARAFSAYLLGHLIFQGSRNETDSFYYGPFKKERHGETNWQLEPGNDYWLHIFSSGSRAVISCRYPKQTAVLEAAVQLFKACYSPTSEANSK